MNALERHWYRLTPLHLILWPLSLLFGLLAAVRRQSYRIGLLKSVRLPVPVVVVGNISVGGTGKTPLTLAFAQHLLDAGRRPLIVSRGYGGRHARPREVAADDSATEVGDEPLLMAQRRLCPVWIGRDRAAAATAGLQHHPECDVVLCDDGLQHYRLALDMACCVIDGERREGNGLLLPAGPLREPRSRLKSMDAMIVNGGTCRPGEFGMQLSGTRFVQLLAPDISAPASAFDKARNHAAAGIGHPQRFFNHLNGLGLHHTAHAFPDHHPFCAEDFAWTDCDAIFLTEKDAVKCAPFADKRFWVLRVDALLDPACTALLLRKIADHGR